MQITKDTKLDIRIGLIQGPDGEETAEFSTELNLDSIATAVVNALTKTIGEQRPTLHLLLDELITLVSTAKQE